MENKVHPFEMTLGLGPYKFIGIIEIKKGEYGTKLFGSVPVETVKRGLGTCAHCGHAIMSCFIIQIENGERFGVGSDCIHKAGLPYIELTKIQKIERERQRTQRAERKAKKGINARNALQEFISQNETSLKTKPHPSRPNSTLLDYANWCIENSNDGGIVFALKKIKDLSK